MVEPKRCESCGMTMKKAKDFGGGKVGNKYCNYCSDENGNLKSRMEVRESMVKLRMKSAKESRNEAEKYVDDFMDQMPAWKKNYT